MSSVRAGQLFLAPHPVTEALECNHLGCKQLHLRNSDCESGFSPSPASSIYQHSCIVEGRERITENCHPGVYRACLQLSQILLEANSTNGGLWEKKGLIFFFSSLLRSRSYSLAEAGLDFAVLPACLPSPVSVSLCCCTCLQNRRPKAVYFTLH